jgi:hypothetical protein
MFNSDSAISKKLVFIWLMLIPLTVLASETLHSEEIAQREQAAKKVTQEFVKRLGSQLKQEMKNSGPVGAISVCRDVAPDIANELSLQNGWRVTRVSSKPRNSMLGTGDEWELNTLAEFERNAKLGKDYKDMTSSQIVLEGGKSYYRFMKPIPAGKVCLTCHGSEKDIPVAVAEKLAQEYPHDKAKGYKLGDLRGAISIKQPIEVAPHRAENTAVN